MHTNPVGSDSPLRDGFLEGAARAFFVMAYADFCENHTTKKLPRPGCYEDWYDYTPPTPPNAYALAGEMWAALQAANGEAGVYTLANRAKAADGVAPDPEEFGRKLAMAYMGTGVHWFDDHKEFPLQMPHAEITAYTFDPAAYEVVAHS